MSTQADAKKGELASDDWRIHNKGRKPTSLPYLIEWRFRGHEKRKPDWYKGPRNWIYVLSDQWGEWKKMKAYKSRDQRDRVFDKLMREQSGLTVHNVSIQYRVIDLPKQETA